ncbi:hypothetical protein AVEN_145567-1 [Araneus ventricosus]|uniref:Uncharacterized protein n=1 Tax=Araneus ventricosus TaxID=182803 RepID=A0A4Y2KBN4_ARAVE|nr:hypothetical protein AVEN_145567-1 [Araneus ventricosus]
MTIAANSANTETGVIVAINVHCPTSPLKEAQIQVQLLPAPLEKKNRHGFLQNYSRDGPREWIPKDGLLHLNHQQNWYCLKIFYDSRPSGNKLEIAGDYNEEL